MSCFSTSNPAFSQAYVLRVRALFSPAETSFTALNFRSFPQQFSFPLRAFAEGYNYKITCCVPRHTLCRAGYFFHREKLRIRRIRQVDLSCYKIKQVPFLQFSCSSLFLFLNPLAVCRAYFLRTHLG